MNPSAHTLPSAIAELYPFVPKSFMTKASHRMSYIDQGTGPVIVALHGNPTWSFYYRNLINELSKTHRVIVPDHLGMGLSDRPNDYPYTLKSHTENLRDLLDSLGIDRLSLVVHDWGGAIGMTYATQYPSTIDKVVLTNTAAFTSQVIPQRINILRGKRIGETLVRGLNAFALPAVYMASSKGLSHEVKQGYLYPYKSWQERIGIARFVQDIPMEKDHQTYELLQKTEELLPSVKGEKLIVWGRKDFCFNDHFLNRWKEIYPEARVCVFEDAGHYVLEDAREEAIAEIKKFFHA